MWGTWVGGGGLWIDDGGSWIGYVRSWVGDGGLVMVVFGVLI